ncbi:putative transporter [Consotaella salsifontis]|uniref:Putative transport protein n=1 Tax=Consotaella salsifontis TaxID=1365950 RepID=A0A1T4PKH1_9HYPH|nr:putative transporter [Consotaella salsifontis]SJZ92063.1 putative transport protein [Consotaella salsifontis]
MELWRTLFASGEGVANALFAVSLVAVAGLAIGEIKVFGIKLGIAGPLFAGIGFGYFGLTMNEHMLEFVREFGLALFVYGIGNAVGPTFFSSFAKDGLRLNALAVLVVGGGALITVFLHYAFGTPWEAVIGLFSGGTTNTPSLAAGISMLRQVNATPDQLATPAAAYAVAYPFGIIGILLVMGLIRIFFSVKIPEEAAEWEKARQASRFTLDRMNIEVQNEQVAEHTIGEVLGGAKRNLVISRVSRDGTQAIADPNFKLRKGDVVLAVGEKRHLQDLQWLLGQPAQVRLQDESKGPIQAQRLVVTHSRLFGKTIGEVNPRAYGVTITRLNRQSLELVPDDASQLQFGDILMVVGERDKLSRFAEVVGNDDKSLTHAQVIPIFVGLALGVILGSIPFTIPGIPVPIKLGLAGGPLIVAILLSRLGSFGPIVWFMPPGVNHIIRELGITCFMVCVGIYSGPRFISAIASGDGLIWMAQATMITFIPLFLVGFFARMILKINYLTLCGVLSGTMTDPPALAFANALSPSQAQATGYSAVYPLTMCLRIIAPQLIIAMLWLL